MQAFPCGETHTRTRAAAAVWHVDTSPRRKAQTEVFAACGKFLVHRSVVRLVLIASDRAQGSLAGDHLKMSEHKSNVHITTKVLHGMFSAQHQADG